MQLRSVVPVGIGVPAGVRPVPLLQGYLAISGKARLRWRQAERELVRERLDLGPLRLAEFAERRTGRPEGVAAKAAYLFNGAAEDVTVIPNVVREWHEVLMQVLRAPEVATLGASP